MNMKRRTHLRTSVQSDSARPLRTLPPREAISRADYHRTKQSMSCPISQRRLLVWMSRSCVVNVLLKSLAFFKSSMSKIISTWFEGMGSRTALQRQQLLDLRGYGGKISHLQPRFPPTSGAMICYSTC